MNVFYNLCIGEEFKAQQFFQDQIANGQGNYQTFIGLSLCNMKLSKYDEAISSLHQAFKLDSSSYETHFLLAQAYFYDGQVKNARLSINHAIKLYNGLKEDLNLLQDWQTKINLQLNALQFVDNSQDYQITKEYYQPEEEQKLSDQIGNLLSKIQIIKLEIKQEKGFTWWQNENQVNLQIPISSDQQNPEIIIGIQEEEFNIEYKKSSSSQFSINLSLWNKIIKEESNYVKKGNIVHITLVKKEKKVIWTTLQKDEKAQEIKVEIQKQQTQSNLSSQQQQYQYAPQPIQNQNIQTNQQVPIQLINQQPAYPSSSKNKKDWSKLDKEMDKELKDEKKDPVLSMFQDLYANADEDTKKAMLKSYQESGGTALSNVWKEVKDKDYAGKDRPQAPKGQEWKKYEY